MSDLSFAKTLHVYEEYSRHVIDMYLELGMLKEALKWKWLAVQSRQQGEY